MVIRIGQHEHVLQVSSMWWTGHGGNSSFMLTRYCPRAMNATLIQATLATSVWTQQDSKGEPSLIKITKPLFRGLSFFFLSFANAITNLWGPFYLWDIRNDVMSIPRTTLGQLLLWDKVLSKNKQKSSIPALKGEPRFQLWCRPTIIWVNFSSFGPVVGAHLSAHTCYSSMWWSVHLFEWVCQSVVWGETGVLLR